MALFSLGISAYYHDSAAALLQDGEIVAAVQQERFSRKKHDARFPAEAVQAVLHEGGVTLSDVTTIVFYDKPLLKFERLLETYHALAPRGLVSFFSSIPVWVKEKLFLKKVVLRQLEAIHGGPLTPRPELLFPEHHLSHAASAFYPSPYDEAAILTIDGVGEWATTTLGHGRGNDITLLKELRFPHSLGLLYSAFTAYLGFKVNSGEYKMMGLAPYGNRTSSRVAEYTKRLREEMVDIREDGSFLLNMDYFTFATGLQMCEDERFAALFSLEKRKPEEALNQQHMDLALAIQEVTEEIVLRLAQTARNLTGCPNLVMSGGVALNCVANGKLQHQKIFENLWIQPAAGDAGGALGAAYIGYHIHQGQQRLSGDHQDKMAGSYLGPRFSDSHTRRLCRKYGAVCHHYDHFNDLARDTAQLLAREKIVGWFQGRMEWGPRALGNRSILGDPRQPEMQKRLNLKIKYREGFRPFAPSVLAEDMADYFDLDCASPYMLLVADVVQHRRIAQPQGLELEDMFSRLYSARSDIPAITHVDYSARVQTVHRETNPQYHQVISEFKKITGYGVLVNTSFNVRGEPIVCSPDDAYRCFMRTEMDYLVIGNDLFIKTEQPAWQQHERWQEQYELD